MMTKNFASHKNLAFYRRRSEIAQKTNINPQKFGLHCVLHRIISKPWKYVPKYLDAPLTKQYVKEKKTALPIFYLTFASKRCID